MMRPLTAFGCITYAPVYIRPSFPGTRPNFPSPVGGRQGRRPSFPSTRPNFAGGRSRLDFLLLLFLCQDKKRRRTRASLSRVKTGEGEEQGLCPFTPPSFLPLMEEKKAKEDQGVRDAGQVFRVPGQTSLPRQGTPAKFSGYVMHLRWRVESTSDYPAFRP